MQKKSNDELFRNAKALRHNMTNEERRLWYCFLKDYPLHFYKQKILGYYIADFYCSKAKLVIELDGSQHYTEAGIEKDTERTKFLNRFGITVIRIPNIEIEKNFAGACAYIDDYIRQVRDSVADCKAAEDPLSHACKSFGRDSSPYK